MTKIISPAVVKIAAEVTTDVAQGSGGSNGPNTTEGWSFTDFFANLIGMNEKAKGYEPKVVIFKPGRRIETE